MRSACGFLLLVFIPVILFAGEQQESRARLEKIRQRIERTSKSLKFQEKQELSLLRDLVTLRTSLQEIERRIGRLQREQKSARHKITAVKREIHSGKQDLRIQEHRLRKRLIALYKEGDTGVLKVLFSSNSPMELAEQYRYLSRILENDKRMMAAFQKIVLQQKKRLAKLQRLEADQRQRLSVEQDERQDARSARKLQAQLLTRVRRDKTKLQSELKTLKDNARRLKALIDRLKFRKTTGTGTGTFSRQKGKLPWPVKGALLVGFGKQRSPEFGTLYESHGIEIAAVKGAAIKAVAAGKVVFADWFKGYGNLLIVSHAGGYHTLYAQADTLLKQVGDKVAVGEALAKSGIPGEQGIYFEIRQNGAPLNPLNWLKSSSRSDYP
ncbi:MAG: peptidoglycan DD-metalloendopeptidase family protein [Geopsychrobacter sp.]|nr:peptidoglycan DD-metalloendopeptidase family protein [Geopsychrobacter sp.]